MSPLLFPFLSFLSGIILAKSADFGQDFIIIALGTSIILFLSAYAAGLRFHKAFSLPVFFFMGGLSILPYSKPVLPPNHLLNFVRASEGLPASKAGTSVEGEVLSVESLGKRTRVLVESGRYLFGRNWNQTTGKALITVNGRPDLLPGDSIRVFAQLNEPYAFGNPGEFDYKGWLKLQGIHVAGYVRNEGLIEKLEDAGPGPLRLLHAARKGIGDLIDSSRLRYGESLKSLVISGQGGIEKGLKDAFAATGTSHVLSISGLHVGIVAAFSYGLILFLLRRSERVLLAINAKSAALIASSVPIVIYGALAGFPVATTRAVIMALTFTTSFALGRGKDYLNCLCLAGLIILVIAPWSPWDISFQLTFAAMASIIVITPRLKSLLPVAEKKDEGRIAAVKRFFEKHVISAVLMTIAAAIGTSPIIAAHFQRVSLVGLISNLVVIPLSSVIVPLLLAASALLPLSKALAIAALHASDAVFALVAWLVRSFAELPYSSVWVSPPKPHEIALYYLFVISVLFIKKGRIYILGSIFFPVVLAGNLIINPAVLSGEDGRLKVTFISVGQGDSALVEFLDKKTMLIDGGGTRNSDFDTGERIVAPFLRSKGIKEIDYMVLSHAQLDHMGGLSFVAANFRIGEFWWNGDGSLGRLGEVLSSRGINIRALDSSFKPVEIGGAKVEVINPAQDLPLDQNDNSLVLKISYGDRRFLFTGDIAKKGEEAVARKDIRADVLKSPHHASRRSSTQPFLDAVDPKVVVISVGRWNSFGFPHEEALARYRDKGAAVYRTDTGGAVTVETDGKYLRESAYLTADRP